MISYVNISQAQVDDAGVYKCTADNGQASQSHEALVSIRGPVFVKQMANVTAVAGTSLTLRCLAVGSPIDEIWWTHNGKRLPTNHRQRVFENGSLQIEHVDKAQFDDGSYTCFARASVQQFDNKDSSSSSSSSASLQDSSSSSSSSSNRAIAHSTVYVFIKAKPSIEPFVVSRSLREGQRASIVCTIASGDLPIAISWFRNNAPLVQISGGTLVIQNNPPSYKQQDTTTSLLFGQQDQQQQQYQNVVLPNVRLSRVSDYSSTLLFEPLLVEHSANYTCSAKNDAGSVSHQMPLVVQGKFLMSF